MTIFSTGLVSTASSQQRSLWPSVDGMQEILLGVQKSGPGAWGPGSELKINPIRKGLGAGDWILEPKKFAFEAIDTRLCGALFGDFFLYFCNDPMLYEEL